MEADNFLVDVGNLKNQADIDELKEILNLFESSFNAKEDDIPEIRKTLLLKQRGFIEWKEGEKKDQCVMTLITLLNSLLADNNLLQNQLRFREFLIQEKISENQLNILIYISKHPGITKEVLNNSGLDLGITNRNKILNEYSGIRKLLSEKGTGKKGNPIKIKINSKEVERRIGFSQLFFEPPLTYQERKITRSDIFFQYSFLKDIHNAAKQVINSFISGKDILDSLDSYSTVIAQMYGEKLRILLENKYGSKDWKKITKGEMKRKNDRKLLQERVQKTYEQRMSDEINNFQNTLKEKISQNLIQGLKPDNELDINILTTPMNFEKIAITDAELSLLKNFKDIKNHYNTKAIDKLLKSEREKIILERP